MEINIFQLTGILRTVAERIDKAGNDDKKINNSEYSLFSAVASRKVYEGEISDSEYISVFGKSSLTEWGMVHTKDHSHGPCFMDGLRGYMKGYFFNSDYRYSKNGELADGDSLTLELYDKNKNRIGVYAELDDKTGFVVLDNPKNSYSWNIGDIEKQYPPACIYDYYEDTKNN